MLDDTTKYHCIVDAQKRLHKKNAQVTLGSKSEKALLRECSLCE